MQAGESSTNEVVAWVGDGRAESEVHAAREVRFQALLRTWWLDERPGWTEADWWDVSCARRRARVAVAAGRAAPGRGAQRHRTHPAMRRGPPGRRIVARRPLRARARGGPAPCMVVLAAAWEACGAWAAAGAARALVDCAGPETVTFSVPEIGLRVSDPAREELACALRTSPASMANRIEGARDLVAHPELGGAGGLGHCLGVGRTPRRARGGGPHRRAGR